MKVYFTCSTAEFFTYRENYFAIRNFLIEWGHILTRDWLPHTEKKLLSHDTEIRDIKKIYKECVTAIREADVVIIEDTVSNFSTGHQITLAQQFRKPTLVLWQGRKYRQFKQMFIHGIESDILQVSEYKMSNLEEIMTGFFSKYSNSCEKNRFHLVLNNMERAYLDWAQYTNNKSRTKVIREALRNMMDKDKEYEEYVSKHKSGE